MTVTFGTLSFVPAKERLDLLAAPTAALLSRLNADDVFVAEIDPALADTAAFCEKYEIGMEVSANCVIVEATRGENSRFAACLILATTRADVNGLVRRHLDARRASFASMDATLAKTSMEYGGITPVGLPEHWPILIDQAVANAERVIIGSGIRGSKLLVTGKFLADLPNAVVLEKLGIVKQ